MAFPITLPVRFPITLPVTLPVTFPVKFKVDPEIGAKVLVVPLRVFVIPVNVPAVEALVAFPTVKEVGSLKVAFVVVQLEYKIQPEVVLLLDKLVAFVALSALVAEFTLYVLGSIQEGVDVKPFDCKTKPEVP